MWRMHKAGSHLRPFQWTMRVPTVHDRPGLRTVPTGQLGIRPCRWLQGTLVCFHCSFVSVVVADIILLKFFVVCLWSCSCHNIFIKSSNFHRSEIDDSLTCGVPFYGCVVVVTAWMLKFSIPRQAMLHRLIFACRSLVFLRIICGI